MAKFRFSYVPDVFPLNFLSSPKSLFAIRRQVGYEILEINEESLSVQRFSKKEAHPDYIPSKRVTITMLYCSLVNF